jgi:beta-N-acetylhexosaminidase
MSLEEEIKKWIEIRDKFLTHATILNIDVIESSKLKLNESEENIIFTFNEFHKFLERIVTSSHGNVLARMGDGGLYIFSNADDCISAAIKIQNELDEFNRTLNKLHKNIRIRIGIDTGKFLFDETQDRGKIFAKVIDASTRAQENSPGNIVITERTYKELKEKSKFSKYKKLKKYNIQLYILNHRKKKVALPILITSIIIAICIIYFSFIKRESPKTFFILSEKEEERINEIINKMSIEEKIGQMMMIGFPGTQLSSEIEELIKKYQIGSVILFSRNIKSQDDVNVSIDDMKVPEEVINLTNSIQDIASQTKHKIPIFIAVDQEGGNTIRIKKGVTIFPGNMALGATRSVKYAYEAGKIIGEELRAMGIHINLAPVVDVNNNTENDIIGPRSFAGDAKLVSKLAISFLKGAKKAGIISTAKHFPGHGDTNINPHKELPIVNYSYDRLKRKEMVPFKDMIDAGVEMVMPAHMDFSNAFGTEKYLPATLSKKIIQNELRGKMKFNGVIISDDLGMKAVLSYGRKIEEAAKLAIQAGNDILMICDYPIEKISNIINVLSSTFKETNIEENINQSVKRILRLKMMINKNLDPENWKIDFNKSKEKLRRKQNVDIADNVAQDAITLVSDNIGIFSNNDFPMKKISPDDKVLIISPLYKYGEMYDHFTKIIQAKEKHYKITSIIIKYGLEDDPVNQKEVDENLNLILNEANDAKIIIAGITRKEHRRIINELVNIGKPIVVISFAEPVLLSYDLIDKNNVTYLVAYSNTEPSIKAVVKVLYGEKRPKPRKFLPISIPEVFDFDTEAVK